MFTLLIFIQHSIRSSSHSNKGRKGNERQTHWEGRNKTVSADDTFVYIEDLKELTKNWKRQKYHGSKKHLSFSFNPQKQPYEMGT